jgi:MFS family permease
MAKQGSSDLLGLAPWQATIICIALPGLVLTPLILTMREPRRRGLVGDTVKLSFVELMRELGKRRLFLVLLIAGMAMANIMTNAMAIWKPALFIRAYGWNATQVGLWLGALILVGSVIGSFLAGWMTDRLTRQSRPDGPITVAAFSFIGAGAFGAVAPLMPTGELALAFMVPFMFLSPMAFACAPIAIQLVIPNQLRAQVSALYYTVLSILGLALGPLVVGMMTDRLFSQPSDVRYSMAIVAAITAPLMVVFMMLARAPFVALRVRDGQL